MLQRVNADADADENPHFTHVRKHKFDLDSALKLPVLLWLSNELH